jgi:tRNA threonylcarbamoyladenosine biosynthesis protein TsaE
MTKSWTTNSAEETVQVGRELAALLRPPLLLILRGDLGAGKTTLVKGLAAELTAVEQEDVTSPTFTLVHEYSGGSVLLYHLDLYRLQQERELDVLGIEEMRREETIVLVEWGEKFASIVAQADGEIAIEHGGGDLRTITLTLTQ